MASAVILGLRGCKWAVKMGGLGIAGGLGLAGGLGIAGELGIERDVFGVPDSGIPAEEAVPCRVYFPSVR